ncbi:redoxin domain-containing protein [Candidatus Entotheonella palauensis]|uniref:redoxin domain-containing protein n=1 Tax=Candidatus Entotheonella palauensis TaxID=93172 RepID=UPI000B7E3A17|nr:redoxin domain-containing protein [Candidatus Entotheonella palauensis]
MNRILLHVTSALCLLALAVLAHAAPKVGQPAPDFTSVDSHGATHGLKDYRGKIVVLEWTNHQCPFVGKHYATGNMQALQKAATEVGVAWLSVISSAPGKQGHVSGPEANALTASRQASPTAVLLDADGVVGRLYDARTTPHMYIIDASGTLVYMGGIDDKASTQYGDVKTAKNYVRVALDELRGDQAVSTPVTRPYGCSVKY